MMYVRPGNLFKDFAIEENKQVVTNTGRVANVHSGDGTRMLKGCLAAASDEDHIVTHTIVQAGSPEAKRGDKLTLGERVFYIIDVDDISSLGISTVYYAEERKDLK